MRFISFFFMFMHYVREQEKFYVKYIIVSVPSYYQKQAVFVVALRNCKLMTKTDRRIGLFFCYTLIQK